MTDTLGARLRKQRESRKISLRAIADQTKIKYSLLEGLERDDISQWPSGIFRRAYVRTYAMAIGLDADVTVREFLLFHPDADHAVDVNAAMAEAAASKSAPPTRLRGIVESAFASLSRLRKREPENAPPVLAAAAEPQDADGVTLRIPAAEADDVPRVVVAPPAAPDPPVPAESPAPDLLAVAKVCTALGRVEDMSQVQHVLRDAARILKARGLIVWIWDAIAEELRPALAHGYPKKLLARLPGVRRDADNVTAAAFRASQAFALDGGALAVPLLTPAGCAGVLALEVPDGSEQTEPVRAVATILAAMLAQLVGGTATANTQPDSDLPAVTSSLDTSAVRQ